MLISIDFLSLLATLIIFLFVLYICLIDFICKHLRTKHTRKAMDEAQII